MNAKLKKAKVDVKKIEQYCQSRPIPTESDLDYFLKANSLSDYREFAEATLKAVKQKEWIFYQNKINKSRV